MWLVTPVLSCYDKSTYCMCSEKVHADSLCDVPWRHGSNFLYQGPYDVRSSFLAINCNFHVHQPKIKLYFCTVSMSELAGTLWKSHQHPVDILEHNPGSRKVTLLCVLSIVSWMARDWFDGNSIWRVMVPMVCICKLQGNLIGMEWLIRSGWHYLWLKCCSLKQLAGTSVFTTGQFYPFMFESKRA